MNVCMVLDIMFLQLLKIIQIFGGTFIISLGRYNFSPQLNPLLLISGPTNFQKVFSSTITLIFTIVMFLFAFFNRSLYLRFFLGKFLQFLFLLNAAFNFNLFITFSLRSKALLLTLRNLFLRCMCPFKIIYQLIF